MKLFSIVSYKISRGGHTNRVVFASVAMGVGIDFHGVNTIIHYGAPNFLLSSLSAIAIQSYFDEVCFYYCFHI